MNSTSPKTEGNKRWLTTSLLFFLGWVFMYADRTILSPVQGVIREEFMLTNAEVGLISSIFFIIYTTTVQIEMWYGSPPGARVNGVCRA